MREGEVAYFRSLCTLHSCTTALTPHSALTPTFITGVGVVLPGMIGNEAFGHALNSPEARPITRDSGPIPEAEYLHLLNARLASGG